MGGAGAARGGVIRATVVVPARLSSTRLPRKVLLDKTGMPMVQHVVEAARGAACAAAVVVATDSAEVADRLREYGTRVVMTRVDHPNGTSRLAEAAGVLGLGDDEVVVNAQGDEPEMPAVVIDAAARALVETAGASVGTVCCALGAGELVENPNIVKVVRRLDGTALYFTRAAVPVDRDAGKHAPLGDRSRRGVEPLRHVGVYAYRVGFLRRYVGLASTPLELAESLEQLRVLEHGHVIAVAKCDEARGLTGIDTAEQYEDFVGRWSRRSGR